MQGCPGQSFNITTDGPNGTPGPEVTMLAAVGYNLTSSTPEPATFTTIVFALICLAVFARRLTV